MMVFTGLLVVVLPVSYLKLPFVSTSDYHMLEFCFSSCSMTILFIVTLIFIVNKILEFLNFYVHKKAKSLKTVLLVFVVSMLFFCVSDSALSMILFWECLGVTSYFLILFYMNWNSYSGGLITFITMRLGDFLFLVLLLGKMQEKWVLFMLFVFIIGSTKSAQVPFSSWLPLAMAAPTPVSALVHSSTLVTAGIFLFSKFWIPMFSVSQKGFVESVSIMTILMGSLSALASSDLKKIVAFSTLSQMGLLVLVSSSMWNGLSLYLLIIHALLKSALFIMAGELIVGCVSQSLMSMNYASNVSTFSNFIVVLMNFCSVWFSSMFVVKEISLSHSCFKILLYAALVLTLSATVLYSTRMFKSLASTPKTLNATLMMKAKIHYHALHSLFGLLWLISFLQVSFYASYVKATMVLVFMVVVLYCESYFTMLLKLNQLGLGLMKSFKTSLVSISNLLKLVKVSSLFSVVSTTKLQAVFMLLTLLLFS